MGERSAQEAGGVLVRTALEHLNTQPQHHCGACRHGAQGELSSQTFKTPVMFLAVE